MDANLIAALLIAAALGVFCTLLLLGLIRSANDRDRQRKYRQEAMRILYRRQAQERIYKRLKEIREQGQEKAVKRG